MAEQKEYFEAKGVVIDIPEVGKYDQEITIDIGTLDKPNEVLFSAYVNKDNGKSFLPEGLKVGDVVSFVFKPTTRKGISKQTGREYCISRLNIRNVKIIEHNEAGQKSVDSAVAELTGEVVQQEPPTQGQLIDEPKKNYGPTTPYDPPF